MLRQQELHLHIYGNVLITCPVFLPCFQLSSVSTLFTTNLFPLPAFCPPFHFPLTNQDVNLGNTYTHTIHFLHITLAT